jgi:hypothetical protein
MKKIKFYLTMFAATTFIACGSGNVRHPDKTTKVDLTGKSVLVVAEDNASGDTVAAKAFIAAAGQKVGTLKVLPAVPDVAKGIAKVYTEFGTKNAGTVNPQDPKVLALDTVLSLAGNLGKFDTIIFVGAEKGSGMAVPKTIKIDLFAAVYDIKSKTVTAAVSDNASVVDTGVAAQMPIKARDITTSLLDGIN